MGSFESGIIIGPSFAPIDQGIRGLGNLADYYAKLYMAQGVSDRKDLREKFQQLYSFSLDKVKKDDREFFNEELTKFRSKLIQAEANPVYSEKRKALMDLTTERDELKAKISEVVTGYDDMEKGLAKMSTYLPPAILVETQKKAGDIMAIKNPTERVQAWNQFYKDDMIHWQKAFPGKTVDDYAAGMKADIVKDGNIDWESIKNRIVADVKNIGGAGWGTYMNWMLGQLPEGDYKREFLDSDESKTTMAANNFADNIIKKMKASHYGAFDLTKTLKTAFGGNPARYSDNGAYSSSETKAAIKKLYEAGNSDIKQAVDYFRQSGKAKTDDDAIKLLEEYSKSIMGKESIKTGGSSSSMTFEGYVGTPGFTYDPNQKDMAFSDSTEAVGYYVNQSKPLKTSKVSAIDADNGLPINYAGDFRVIKIGRDASNNVMVEFTGVLPGSQKAERNKSAMSFDISGQQNISLNGKTYVVEPSDGEWATGPKNERIKTYGKIMIDGRPSYIIKKEGNMVFLDSVLIKEGTNRGNFIVKKITGDFANTIDAAYPGLRASLLNPVLTPKK